MLKNIFAKILNTLKNIGIVIFSFLGFSFVKASKKEENEETSSGDETTEGGVKPINIPLPDTNDVPLKPNEENMISLKKNFTTSKRKKINETLNNEVVHDLETPKKYFEETYEKLGIKIYNDEFFNIIVSDVFENSPAFKAGFEIGDKITKVNGVSFKNTKTIVFIKEMEKVEAEEIKITVIRKEKEKKLVIPKVLNKPKLTEINNIREQKEEKNEEKEINKIVPLSHVTIENPKSKKVSFETKEIPSQDISKEVFEDKKEIFLEEVKIANNEDNYKNIEDHILPLDNFEKDDVIKGMAVATIPVLNDVKQSISGTIKQDKVEITTKQMDKPKENIEANMDEKTKEENVDIEENKIKDEKNKDENKKDKNEILENEALTIAKITNEDIKEKEKKIRKSINERKTLSEILKVDNRYKISLLPFMIFNRRMVRNVYKAYLLNNSLVSARKLIGSFDASYSKLNYRDLLFHIRTTKTFANMTYDNLYNIDMLKMEIKKKYGDEIKTDPYLKEAVDRIEYLEARTIARHQRLIEKQKDLKPTKVKKLLLIKKDK